jgi:hypothetical protein
VALSGKTEWLFCNYQSGKTVSIIAECHRDTSEQLYYVMMRSAAAVKQHSQSMTGKRQLVSIVSFWAGGPPYSA